MAAPLAFEGTFADFKLIKTRSVVQIVIEMPIEHGPAVVASFGLPSPGAEIPVGIARLIPAATIEHAPAPTRRFGEMPRAQQAGIRCGEPAFWRFLGEKMNGAPVGDAEEAAMAVRVLCNVRSRSELDGRAFRDWDELSAEFSMWMRNPEIAG